LAEIVTQYEGIGASDSAMEPLYTLAELYNVPVGIHMGPGPSGIAYSTNYRSRFSSPLMLEEALVRHPKLRVYVMHAGWPMLDDMVAMLYAYPNLYVDIAVIDWYIPKKEFYFYLKRLVEAGFSNRIMFGSDQMQWPQSIGAAIETIESADFLTKEQKRDIFYNNAVRFFRLENNIK
jgi:predicted TIM-barrel fold metal-dependent hydrolase